MTTSTAATPSRRSRPPGRVSPGRKTFVCLPPNGVLDNGADAPNVDEAQRWPGRRRPLQAAAISPLCAPTACRLSDERGRAVGAFLLIVPVAVAAAAWATASSALLSRPPLS